MKIILISGCSGSGKSLVANFCKNKFHPEANIINLDNYYYDKNEQINIFGRCNYDLPEAYNLSLLKSNIFDLEYKGTAKQPLYCFKQRKKVNDIILKKTKLLIIEGLYADFLLRDHCTLSIFINTDKDLCLLRRINRDLSERNRTIQEISNQYIKDVRPALVDKISKQRDSADVIINNNQSKVKLFNSIENIISLTR